MENGLTENIGTDLKFILAQINVKKECEEWDS